MVEASDHLSKLVKVYIDFLTVSEAKLDDSFSEGQFLFESFHSPFGFDRNKNGCGFLLNY